MTIAPGAEDDALVGNAGVPRDSKEVTWVDVTERAPSCQGQSPQADRDHYLETIQLMERSFS